MNSKIFFVILIILAGAIIFGTTLKPKNELLTQNKTMGVVDVKITPVSVDNNDNSAYPSSWTGNSSGHHVEGKLIFPSFSKKPKELTLTLNEVDNKSETFSWKL